MRKIMIPMTINGTTTPTTMATTLIVDAVALTLDAAELKLGGGFASTFDGKGKLPWVADGRIAGTVSVLRALRTREGARTEGRNHSEHLHTEGRFVGSRMNTLLWSAILTILYRPKSLRSVLL